MLRNTMTGSLYVGRSMDLGRRFSEWRGVFTAGLNIRSLRMLAHLQDTNPEDWEFCILAELPMATEQELADYEERAITKLSSKNPEKVLNTLINANVPKKALGATAPKSVVLHNNIPISYSAAAKILGSSVKQLQKRLARYRKEGVTTVELEVLKELSDRYTGRAGASDSATV